MVDICLLMTASSLIAGSATAVCCEQEVPESLYRTQKVWYLIISLSDQFSVCLSVCSLQQSSLQLRETAQKLEKSVSLLEGELFRAQQETLLTQQSQKQELEKERYRSVSSLC